MLTEYVGQGFDSPHLHQLDDGRDKMTSTLVPDTVLTKNAGSDYSTTGNMPVAESRIMSIDMENASFIMDALINLYSNPLESTIREYVANALDSHTAAGTTDPVEVTTPGTWNTSITIKDHGIGMSKDEVFRYGTFGSSSKRDDLSLVGNFGMGSKSALTITDSFMVDAVKDGEHTLASIGRSDDGSGNIDILVHETGTDLPNGVTITIPYSGGHWTVSEAVRSATQGVPSGKIKIDGNMNVCRTDSMTEFSDGVFTNGLIFSNGRYYSPATAMTVNVGGFNYPVDYNKFKDEYADYKSSYSFRPEVVVVNIPIGSIDLTPSREDIRYTTRTSKFLQDTITNVLREFNTRYVEEFTAITSVSDLIETIDRNDWWGNITYYDLYDIGVTPTLTVKYDGTRNVDVASDDGTTDTVSVRDVFGIYMGANKYASSRSDLIGITTRRMSELEKVYLVNNDKNYKLTGATTTKIRRFVDIMSSDVDDPLPDNTAIIVPTEDFDSSNYDETHILGYLLDKAETLDMSRIYAVVRDNAKKSNKGQTTKPQSSSANPLDSTIQYIKAEVDDDGQPEHIEMRTSPAESTIKDMIANHSGYTFVWDNTKKSGNAIIGDDFYSYIEFVEFSRYVLHGASNNVIFISPGNRKFERYEKIIPGVMSVGEYLDEVFGQDSESRLESVHSVMSHSAAQHTINMAVESIGMLKYRLRMMSTDAYSDAILDYISALDDVINNLKGKAPTGLSDRVKFSKWYGASTGTIRVLRALGVAHETIKEYYAIGRSYENADIYGEGSLVYNTHNINSVISGAESAISCFSDGTRSERVICAIMDAVIEQLEEGV